MLAKNFLLSFFFLIELIEGIESNAVYIKNFGFNTTVSFKISNTFSNSLISSVNFDQPSSNRIRCLSQCSRLANCTTVEITRDTLQTDLIKQCAFYSNIPNFNSTDVIASVSSNVYVKKISTIQFNQSCVYDNCQQGLGLTCVSGRCLCRDNSR